MARPRTWSQIVRSIQKILQNEASTGNHNPLPTRLRSLQRSNMRFCDILNVDLRMVWRVQRTGPHRISIHDRVEPDSRTQSLWMLWPSSGDWLRCHRAKDPWRIECGYIRVHVGFVISVELPQSFLSLVLGCGVFVEWLSSAGKRRHTRFALVVSVRFRHGDGYRRIAPDRSARGRKDQPLE